MVLCHFGWCFAVAGDLLGSFGMLAGSFLEAWESSGMPLGSILVALGSSGTLPGGLWCHLVSFGLAMGAHKVLE